jgi:hypothetical protein
MLRARTPKPRRVTADPPSPVGVLDVQDVFECVAYHLIDGAREELIPNLAAWSCCCKDIQYSNAVYAAAAAKLGLDNTEKRVSFMSKPMDRPARGVFHKMATLYWEDKEGIVTANWLDSERANDDMKVWKRMAHAAEHSSLKNPLMLRLAMAALGEMRCTHMCNHTSWMRLLVDSMTGNHHAPMSVNALLENTVHECGPNCTVVMVGDRYRPHAMPVLPSSTMPLDCFVVDFIYIHNVQVIQASLLLETVVSADGYSGLHVNSKGDLTHSVIHKVCQAAMCRQQPDSTKATLRILLAHPLKQWRWTMNGNTIVHALFRRKFWRSTTAGRSFSYGMARWKTCSDVLLIMFSRTSTGPGSIWTKKNNAGQTPLQLFHSRYSLWHKQCTESHEDPSEVERELAWVFRRIESCLKASEVPSTPLD